MGVVSTWEKIFEKSAHKPFKLLIHKTDLELRDVIRKIKNSYWVDSTPRTFEVFKGHFEVDSQ